MPSPTLPALETPSDEGVRDAFQAFVEAPDFSCLGARAALRHPSYAIEVYGAMADPNATAALARDLASFAAGSAEGDFATFVAVFAGQPAQDEITFEAALWGQLQGLHPLDPAPTWVVGVSDDPDDVHFSFSFAGCAFFVVGLHPGSSRAARRFAWPTLVFNPHAQFERLRADGRYPKLRKAIRTREMALQGSLNPNLSDFGERSEARQYSGRATEAAWRCPFHRVAK
jgi:FPC/CPF motif-containing protein YcgG